MRKFKKRLLTVLAIFIFAIISNFSIAQSATVKGNVKDGSGNPLSGASVTVEPKNIGTTTDASGNFSLKVPAGTYTLIVSYVGLATQRQSITVKAGETLEKNVGLTPEADLGEVHVVGSRSNRARTLISTPVPVDIIQAREVKQFAQSDVTQLLTYAAPSFQSARQTITDGTDHIDPAGLRGLGPDQTLVLLNGKRRHTTALVNINGSVGRGSVGTDMNAIPVAAIERIEVLRDGAAAQYGSDAIAGVINLVLKKKWKGAGLSMTTGGNITDMPLFTGNQHITDGFTRQLDFSAGTYSKKSGAYINLSGQYLGREKTNRSGYDNIPLEYIGNGGAFPGTQAGIDPTAYRRFLIDYDKQIVAQRGYQRHNMINGQSSAYNLGAFLNAGIPLGGGFDLYTTIGSSHRTGQATGNARIPNAITQMPWVSTGYGLYQDGFLPEIHTVINDYSFIAGVKGKLGNFDVDLSNTYGQNTMGFRVENSGNASLAATANPQTSFDAGNQNFYQNTVNLDLNHKFEMANKNDFNLAFGGEWRKETFVIGAGEVNSYINGGRTTTPFNVPAYPGTGIGTLIGASNAVAGAQVFPGFSPADALSKSRNVYAGYVDGELTLGNLLLGAAARYESYKEEKVTYNGTGFKLTGRYEFTKNMAVRGSVSTGFRAPSLHQRYFQNTSTQFVGGLPSQSLTANNDNPIVRNAFGINELKPETSTSFTAGFVAKFGNGFTATIDGYYIKIADRIVLSTAFNYFSTNPDSTNYKTPTQKIFQANGVDPKQVAALQFWTNAIDTKTTGVDIVLTKNYRTSKSYGNISLAANFSKTTIDGATHTNSLIDAEANNPSRLDPTNYNPALDLSYLLFDRQQRIRLEKGQPRSKINLTANHNIGKVNLLARIVYFGAVTSYNAADPYATKSSGVYWNDAAFGSDQTYQGKATTDFVFTYKIIPGINFSAGVNNLFDVYPDQIFVDPRNSASAVYATPVAGALGTSKVVGGYTAGRDQTNRGRALFGSNQFGYNGRYLFARTNVDFGELLKPKAKPMKAIPEAPVAFDPPVIKPVDTDGDGTPDKDDACPTQAGPAALKGCPDRDGDGVADKDDLCPDQAGPRYLNGCPDKDGDGVPDKDDKCPDVAGSAKYQGCPPPDTDGDGVPDDVDQCPTVKGTFANNGCPEKTAEKAAPAASVAAELNKAAHHIYFETGSAALNMAASKAAINDVKTLMKSDENIQLDIEGHTDNTGSATANQRLSQRRADAVKAALVKAGISANRMTATGYGAEQPVSSNNTAAGRAKNRRVVLKIK